MTSALEADPAVIMMLYLLFSHQYLVITSLCASFKNLRLLLMYLGLCMQLLLPFWPSVFLKKEKLYI